MKRRVYRDLKCGDLIRIHDKSYVFDNIVDCHLFFEDDEMVTGWASAVSVVDEDAGMYATVYVDSDGYVESMNGIGLDENG